MAAEWRRRREVPEGQRLVEVLHPSGQLFGLVLYTFEGGCIQDLLLGLLLCFCMGRPDVQEFDDCIHVAEATTVDAFALDDTMYFVKLPYFGQLLNDECTYV